MEASPSGYELDGYTIDGSTIRFALLELDARGSSNASVELVFRDVEGYFFRRNAAADVTLAVEEQQLQSFLADNEAHFAREARWGWPRFWQGSAEQTAAWLATRGRRVWTVSASYGLSGWIVAAAAAYQNTKASGAVDLSTSLADWRPGAPARR